MDHGDLGVGGSGYWFLILLIRKQETSLHRILQDFMLYQSSCKATWARRRSRAFQVMPIVLYVLYQYGVRSLKNLGGRRISIGQRLAPDVESAISIEWL